MRILVYGPQACGKTRNKHKLMRALGCTSVIDGFQPYKRDGHAFRDDSGAVHRSVPTSALVLTNLPEEAAKKNWVRFGFDKVISFPEAMESVEGT